MPLLVDIHQLTIINKLVRDGASNVASSFGALAGFDTTSQIRCLSFVNPEDLADEMGSDETYVANVQLTEPPYGTVLLTFSTEAAEVVAKLVTGQSIEDGLSEIHQSALQEMCNICTSGFIDGLANTLDTTIDMETPDLRRIDGEEILRSELSHIRDESIAVVLDSTVGVPEQNEEVTLNVYLVPAPGSFVNLLDTIEKESLDRTVPDPVSSEP